MYVMDDFRSKNEVSSTIVLSTTTHSNTSYHTVLLRILDLRPARVTYNGSLELVLKFAVLGEVIAPPVRPGAGGLNTL